MIIDKLFLQNKYDRNRQKLIQFHRVCPMLVIQFLPPGNR